MEILIAFIAGMIVGGFVGLLIGGLAQAARKGDDYMKKGASGGTNNVRVLREEDQGEG